MAGRLLRAGGGRPGVAALPRALLAASGPGLCPRRGCAPEEAAGEAEAALLALGFSRAQARRLRGLQPRLGPRRAAAAAEQLLLLGLSAEAALGLLERSPELLRAAEAQLKERAEYLRRLGLGGAGGRALPPGLHLAPAEDGGGGAGAAGEVPLHGRAADGGPAELPRGAAGGARQPPVPLPVRVLQDGGPPEGDGQGTSFPNALR